MSEIEASGLGLGAYRLKAYLDGRWVAKGPGNLLVS